jgi:lysophospholipase L1-like esterase
MPNLPLKPELSQRPEFIDGLLARACALAALAATALSAQVAKPLKWACIGNSITQGYTVAETVAYPAKLAKLLGPGFTIENDGVSGTTLLKAGDNSYWKNGKLTNVFAYKPDIITIKLGTNDSKPINWDAHKGEFERDYLALIDTLSAMPQKPRILLCLPAPAFTDLTGNADIRGSIVKNEIIPAIKRVAQARSLAVIDLNTPFQNLENLFPDKIHPNAVGHDSIAAFIFRAFQANSKRLACIGNSITQYTAQANTDPKDAYPVKLSELLGANWYTVNQGWSGAYVQKVSPQPYWNSTRLKDVINFKPDVITIKLGTNDSRQQDWHADKFIADFKSMIDTLNTISPKPKIWLVTPVPAWQVNGAWPYNGINDSIIKNQTLPALKQVAKDKGLEIIDVNTPMVNLKRLVPDGVHPNAEGQDSLAHWIYRVLNTPTMEVVSKIRRGSVWPEIEIRGRNMHVTLPVSSEGRVRLYSVDGREMASLALQRGEASLVVSGLSKGRYFISVEASSIRLRAVKAMSF